MVRSPTGSILVSVEADQETWLRFRTTASYNAFREHLDREQVAHETAAIAEYEAERDAYHRRMQELRVERIELTDPEGAA